MTSHLPLLAFVRAGLAVSWRWRWSPRSPLRTSRCRSRRDPCISPCIGDTGTGELPQSKVGQVLTAGAREVSVRLRADARRQHLRERRRRAISRRSSRRRTGAAGRRREVLRGARQSRRPDTVVYKPFNMNGERYYTFKPDQRERPLLRARQQLHGREAARLAGKGAGGQRVRLEDRVLPPPAVLVGRTAWVRFPLRAQAGAALREVRRRRRVHRPRTFLRAHQAAEGHSATLSAAAPAKLRTATSAPTALTEKGFDTGYHFMLVEWPATNMYFQVISDQGKTVDSGVVARRPVVAPSR